MSHLHHVGAGAWIMNEWNKWAGTEKERSSSLFYPLFAAMHLGRRDVSSQKKSNTRARTKDSWENGNDDENFLRFNGWIHFDSICELKFVCSNEFWETFMSLDESGLINKRINCFLSVTHPPSLLSNSPSAAARLKNGELSFENMFPCLIPFRRAFWGLKRKCFAYNDG